MSVVHEMQQHCWNRDSQGGCKVSSLKIPSKGADATERAEVQFGWCGGQAITSPKVNSAGMESCFSTGGRRRSSVSTGDRIGIQAPDIDQCGIVSDSSYAISPPETWCHVRHMASDFTCSRSTIKTMSLSNLINQVIYKTTLLQSQRSPF